MNLQLAIALTCTETGCEARPLGQADPVHADLSEPMLEHQIALKPGDWIVVNRKAESPQVVFRLTQFKVERVVGQEIFVHVPGRPTASMPRADGVNERIVAGDIVFAANDQICDIAVNGNPGHPERLQAILFPQIRAMYQQIQVWDALDAKQVVEQGYDRIAERHLEWAKSVRVEERARYTSVLLDQLSPGAQVLDLGCGAGVPTTLELARKFRVTGVDISKHQIALARQNVPTAQFIEADITQLDFPPASFDAVIAFYALIHIPRQEQSGVLRNISTWLRPGGLLVATMSKHAARRDFGEDFLGTRMFWSGFDGETNKRLVQEAGLQIMRAQEETAVEFDMPITFLWVVARKPT